MCRWGLRILAPISTFHSLLPHVALDLEALGLLGSLDLPLTSSTGLACHIPLLGLSFLT